MADNYVPISYTSTVLETVTIRPQEEPLQPLK